MFLNSGPHLSLLAEMKAHAMDMSEAILRSNFESFGRLVGKTWIQNQALDCGTNPPAVAAIIEKSRITPWDTNSPVQVAEAIYIW